jgi:hypothetical protein
VRDTQIAFFERVRFDQYRAPEIMKGMQALAYTAPTLFGSVLLVSSVRDGKHCKGSCHYVAGAFDARILGNRLGAIKSLHEDDFHDTADGHDWQRRAAREWCDRANQVLPGWQFMVNTKANGIHAEIDPHGRARAEK